MTVADTITSPVAVPIKAYNDMSVRWELPDDLLGGTLTMQQKATRWLPKEQAETEPNYKVRVSRSILINRYADALETVSSKPFTKAVQLKADLPDQLKGMIENIDGEGRNLDQFAKDILRAGVHRGLVHVLVDYADVTTIGEPVTLATENKLGLLPRFVQVDASNLIGWQVQVLTTGQIELLQIRIKEVKTEPDGAYGEKQVNYIRVVGKASWELWRENNDKTYGMVRSGTHTFGKVPLYTFYTKRLAHMLGEPAFDSLAWLNLAHFQSYSDQKNILRFARSGLVFVKGLTDEEMGKDIVIGGNSSFKSQNKDADMKYVEHTGSAIGAGRQDCVDLEEEMAVASLSPFLRTKSGNPTATGQAIDETNTQSEVQSWIRNEENLLEACFEAAAQWKDVELPEGFGVDIFNDFALSQRTAEDIKSLLMARQAKEIDQKTFLQEIKRRTLLAENTNVDDVIEALAKEGPDMGMIGRTNEPGVGAQ
jgi:hypothetical protein